MKVVILLFGLVALAAARSAYLFSDGYLEVLGAEPARSFECAGRNYGYYADVATDCRVFHVCLPISDDLGEVVETAQFSFFCGNQTVFSQESLTCSHPLEAFPCEQAETLYDLSNADFGKVPEEGK
ncbi:U-scoloptoxin(01)-Cw1a-like [Procambarus clarkii]|uniref:U-scoloptoxin(01)-Cw1a-like n=1 Tax=Procambarus clarkii TaxID=6728 RepID=UPI0037421D75